MAASRCFLSSRSLQRFRGFLPAVAIREFIECRPAGGFTGGKLESQDTQQTVQVSEADAIPASLEVAEGLARHASGRSSLILRQALTHPSMPRCLGDRCHNEQYSTLCGFVN